MSSISIPAASSLRTASAIAPAVLADRDSHRAVVGGRPLARELGERLDRGAGLLAVARA